MARTPMWARGGNGKAGALIPRARVSAFLSAAITFLILALPLFAAPTHPRVLILSTDPHTSPGFPYLEASIRRVLTAEFPAGLELSVEHLDLVYYTSPEYRQSLAAMLDMKYSDRRPNLVIAVGKTALDFAISNKQSLFPDARILFGHVDGRQLEGISLPKDVAGILSHWSFDAGVDDALRLLPDTRRVVVVLGAGPLEQSFEPMIRKAFARFDGRINMEWWIGLPIQELETRAASLPPRTVILWVIQYRDRNGARLLPPFVLERLASRSSAPIFGAFAHHVGRGLVGDGRVNLEDLGLRLGQAAVRLLRGESPQSIGVTSAPETAPVFDARQLERWNIPRRQLPEGSRLLFETRPIWVEYRKSFVAGVSLIVLLAGAVTQLLARRRAERAEQETRNLHRVVVDSLPQRIATVDREGVILTTNRAWREFASNGDGQPALGVGANYADAAMQALRGGRSDAGRTVESLLAVLSGHEQARQVVYDPEGIGHGPRYEMNIISLDRHEGGGVITIEDVTDRWRSEERVHFALESLPVATVLLDLRGGIELANAETERLFGFRRDDLAGVSIEELVPGALRRIDEQVNGALPREPGTTPLPGRGMTGRRKDGIEVPVDVHARKIRMSDRDIVLASILDLSERRRFDSEMQRLRAETAHFGRVAAAGEMSAAIAHELNQPLTGILANAQAAQRFLDSGNFNPQDLSEMLGDIAADSRRAGKIIQSLRALLRKDPVEIRAVDLNETVEQVVRLVGHDLLLRGSSLDLELAEDLPTVRGDRVHLQQVVLNLVLNGADAMSDVPPEKRRLLLRTASGSDRTVELKVVDSGPGIPPEVMPHLFEPFFTTKANGMGMGLSIVRSILETHGGRIMATNNSSGGATFSVLLPAAPLEGEPA